MKKFKIAAVFCALAVLVFMLTGCNGTGVENNESTPIVTDTAKAEEKTSTAAEETDSGTTLQAPTGDSDDLEILTVPATESAEGNDTEAESDITAAATMQTDLIEQETQETRIELPVVPAP